MKIAISTIKPTWLLPALFLALFTPSLSAQIQITGQVIDSVTTQPVIGANLVVSGTDDGGSTDTEGKFLFVTQKRYPLILIVTHIAYKRHIVPLSADTTLIIALIPATLPGQEVTVTGARTRADAEVSTAIIVITPREIELAGAADVSTVLSPIAAIDIVVAPYGGQTISIRNSNANEVPVYLDGIRLNDAYSGEADLSLVDLSDVTSIEVVKGGSAALYGQGALGGAVSLSTRQPDRSRISFSRGIGIDDEMDQDLSMSGTLRLGPLAVGGRYTGKSRRYNGRSLITNLQSIKSVGFYPDFGQFTAKVYERQKFIEFPSGLLLQSDSTYLAGLRYRGSILGGHGWDISAGRRTWLWDDSFFTGLNRDLEDSNDLYRITKAFSRGPFEATFQTEREIQQFYGIETSFNAATQEKSIQNTMINRSGSGYVGILKVISQSNHAYIEHIKWEFAYRRDFTATEVDYARRDYNEITSLEAVLDSSLSASFRKNRTKILRLGFQVEGRAPNYEFELYVNQGSNQRIPTLRDLFLYHSAPAVLRGAPLEIENYSSADIGLRLRKTKWEGSDASAWVEVNLEIFANSYIQKIAYRRILGNQLMPYNRFSAQLRGIELTLKAATRHERLIATFGAMVVSVSDPLVFPNKPLARTTFQIDGNLPWASLRLDYRWEGPEFIVRDELLDLNTLESINANFSLVLRRKIYRFNISMIFNIRNLLDTSPVFASAESNREIPFEYFEVHRKLIAINIEL